MGACYSSARLVYRYIGGETHQPLLMVVLTSAVSALAVLFTWALARRAWDSQVAQLAAWIIALFPEAVLLGSSQMREAFTITLVVVAFYGLVRYQQERTWRALAWMVTPLVLYLPFSPPFAALLLAMLALTMMIMTLTAKKEGMHQRYFWIILVVLVFLILIGLWVALRQFTPQGMNNPFAMLSWWLRKSSYLQAYYSKHASGWMQNIFEKTPDWSHLPMLLVYGVVRPFLPAAIVVGSHGPDLALDHPLAFHWMDADANLINLRTLPGFSKKESYSKEYRRFLDIVELWSFGQVSS